MLDGGSRLAQQGRMPLERVARMGGVKYLDRLAGTGTSHILPLCFY